MQYVLLFKVCYLCLTQGYTLFCNSAIFRVPSKKIKRDEPNFSPPRFTLTMPYPLFTFTNYEPIVLTDLLGVSNLMPIIREALGDVLNRFAIVNRDFQ